MASDHERFTEMYDECRQRVWAYAVAHGGRQLADEVVSETFAIAWRRFADVPSPALPWLIGVARNVLRETVRADARRVSLQAELRAWAESDHAEQVADRLAVLRAVATLPHDDREILLLVAWQGLGPRDAARVLGCGVTAFRVRLHRARKRLALAVAAENPRPAEPAAARAGR